MAYFLKKTKLKNRTYLAIYESFYSHDKKGTVHKCYKSLGSIETLVASGMEDPVAHFQAEVDELNKVKWGTGKRKKAEEDELNKVKRGAGIRKISTVSPLLYLGYFPLKSIMDKLGAKKYVDYFKLTNDFRFDIYELLAALIYARSVNLCGKYRAFHEVLPNLYPPCNYSYDQLSEGLSFFGANYEKLVELFTCLTGDVYGIEASKTYFGCTDFFCEIHGEDGFRKKGPGKGSKKDPVVGLGLLLDRDLIPVGMKMYPGNGSETPALRDVVEQMKERHNIVGRTVHVAGKGLDCDADIAFSKKDGDGYLFSKSVKGLPEKEEEWVLLDQGFHEVRDDTGKVLYRYKSRIDRFPYEVEHGDGKATVWLTEKRLLTYSPSKSCVGIDREAMDQDLRFAGYDLLVTSETEMTDQDIYDTYHDLRQIEESFRIMKSGLDARPGYAQREGAMKGHFLICYLAILLERILQVKELGNKYSASEILHFMKDFRVVKGEDRYINTTLCSDFIDDLAEKTHLPLTHYFLSETQLKSIMGYKL